MLTSLVGVIILLGGLIFFHELGHYSVAKFFGVKVEVFCLGFGKKIFSKVWGETEYCIALIPLGGYVKLMGDDPYKGVPAAEAERAFSTQKLYKRFLVVAAGPIANLLLAYVLFTFVFWFGKPEIGTKIGNVLVNSPAWEAGFRSKDRILEANGVRFETWNQFEEYFKGRAGEKADIKVDRSGTELKIQATVEKVRLRNDYGQEEEVGGIRGLKESGNASFIGISDPKSVGYLAGLRTGDEIVKVGTTSVLTFGELEDALVKQWTPGQPQTFTYKRRTEKGDALPEQSVSIVLPKGEVSKGYGAHAINLGFYPSDVFVKQLTPGSPAEQGGLLAGDRIVKVGGNPIYHFDGIVELVQTFGAREEAVPFVLERNGQPVNLLLKPVKTMQEDPLTHEVIKRFMVGFSPMTVLREPELIKFQIREPLRLVPFAIHETNALAQKMVISLYKLVRGEISPKNLGGPVLIASVAGKSLDAGIIPFLQMMALISINLFLLNLFPIPVLDGGHLFFFTIEALKGKPVSLKTMELANQVGMAFILLLVVFTLYNDISRILVH